MEQKGLALYKDTLINNNKVIGSFMHAYSKLWTKFQETNILAEKAAAVLAQNNEVLKEMMILIPAPGLTRNATASNELPSDTIVTTSDPTTDIPSSRLPTEPINVRLPSSTENSSATTSSSVSPLQTALSSQLNDIDAPIPSDDYVLTSDEKVSNGARNIVFSSPSLTSESPTTHDPVHHNFDSSLQENASSDIPPTASSQSPETHDTEKQTALPDPSTFTVPNASSLSETQDVREVSPQPECLVSTAPEDSSYAVPVVFNEPDFADTVNSSDSCPARSAALAPLRPEAQIPADTVIAPKDDPMSIIPEIIEELASKIDDVVLKKKIMELKEQKHENLRSFCDSVRDTIDDNSLEFQLSDYQKKCHKMFTEIMDPKMKMSGYCCSERPRLNIPTYKCNGLNFECRIGRGEVYFYPDRKEYFNDPNVLICKKCFEGFKESGCKRIEMTTAKSPFDIAHFKEKVNDGGKAMERQAECKKCRRKWHACCSMFFAMDETDQFICNPCRKANPEYGLPAGPVTVDLIPHCPLSQFTEGIINRYLKDNKANCTVHIRVLYDSDQSQKVSRRIKKRYPDEGQTITTRCKGIYMFQTIDGKDVCLFGMRTQEILNEGRKSSLRTANIAWLDSVKFFTESSHRSMVYKLILASYLGYVKTRGFHRATVWAHPPLAGDDYIFPCHPPDQQQPTPSMLDRWYRLVYRMATKNGWIFNYENGTEFIARVKPTTPLEFPYFPGNIWPTLFEDTVGELEGKKKKESIRRRRTRHRRAEEEDDDEPDQSGAAEKLEDKMIVEAMCEAGYTDQNFFINLIDPAQQDEDAEDIEPEDEIDYGPLMADRESFADFAYGNGLEFSSLRRAKYATMVMLLMLWKEWDEKPEREAAQAALAAKKAAAEARKAKRAADREAEASADGEQPKKRTRRYLGN